MSWQAELQSILELVLFYLLGAYPTGYIIAKSQGIDILNLGSGNPGATNISRALGLRAGFWTLAGDVSKGLLAAGLAFYLWGTSIYTGLCAFFTVLGHCFSIPGKLRGGKGVATALGTLIVLQPLCALLSVVVFALCLTLTKVASLASLAATFGALISTLLLYRESFSALGVTLITTVVIFRHRSNLRRLLRGVELPLSFARRNKQR